MQAFIGLLIVIIIGGGIWFFLGGQSNQENNDAMIEQEHMTEDGSMMEDKNNDAMMEDEKKMDDGSMKEDGGAMMEEGNNVVSFTVEGKNFSFAPSSMQVKKGDTVRVTFKNVGGFHDFVIDELSVATKQINTDESTTVEFVADKAGSFEYYCSVGNHRERGMVGTLTVSE